MTLLTVGARGRQLGLVLLITGWESLERTVCRQDVQLLHCCNECPMVNVCSVISVNLGRASCTNYFLSIVVQLIKIETPDNKINWGKHIVSSRDVAVAIKNRWELSMLYDCQMSLAKINTYLPPQVIPRCPRCPATDAMAIMKPDIVFFGESLPREFHDQMELDKDVCDLIIVVGSSLKVRPVALIPSEFRHELVGGISWLLVFAQFSNRI